MKKFILTLGTIALLYLHVDAQDVEIETSTVINDSLILKNTHYFTDSDNGVIYSDPDVVSSDIIISANDGVAFDIGKQDVDAEFSIFYHGSTVHKVTKDGDTEIAGKVKVGPSGIFMRNLTGGTIIVGPDNGANDALGGVIGKAQITHTFAIPFTAIPHITATAKHEVGTSVQDTFSVTVQSVSTTAVTFLIKRTDSTSGWGMNLLLDWWGFEI